MQQKLQSYKIFLSVRFYNVKANFFLGGKIAIQKVISITVKSRCSGTEVSLGTKAKFLAKILQM